jgi:hypothetical protein
MSVTDAELAAGVTAAQNYEGWEAILIGPEHNEQIVGFIVDAADSAADQSALGRAAVAEQKMRAEVNALGYGSQVSDSMIAGITLAVLGAVATLRSKQPQEKTT